MENAVRKRRPQSKAVQVFDLAVKEASLVVSIASNILKIDGFLLTISKDDDVTKVISLALASNA